MALSIRLKPDDPFGVPLLFHADPSSENPPKEDQPFVGSFVVRIETETHWPHPSGGFLVGYSPVCTHMGCLLVRKEDDHHVVHALGANGDEVLTCGPCPCHGTTFDLLKRGLVVLGQATQNLAQLKLTVEPDTVKTDGWIENEKQHIDPREETWP